jgi:peptidoglycan/LPS O-acetylase OafA/YrhL
VNEIKKYAYIDALRGLAILLVILVHVGRKIGLTDTMSYLSFKGQYGVQLFFITSALTLFFSYHQRSKTDGKNTVRFFLLRRVFRIVPAFYMAIAFYSIAKWIQPISTFPNHIEMDNILLNATFLAGFSPGAINYIPPGGWSVAVEMTFYLLIPFLFLRIKSVSMAFTCFIFSILLSVLANILGNYVMLHYTGFDAFHRSWFLYFWLPNQLPIFLLGVLLYQLIKTNRRLSKTTGVAMVVLASACIFITFYLTRIYKPGMFFPEHIVVAGFSALIVYSMSQCRLVLLNNRITRFFGKISFSMYLWHFAALELTAFIVKKTIHFIPNLQLLVLYLLTVSVTAFISYWTYQKIELPGIRIGEAVIDRLRNKNSGIPAAARLID